MSAQFDANESARHGDGESCDGVSVTEAEDFLQWRYPRDDYVHYQTEARLIAKRGSGSSYVRVCQTSGPLQQSGPELVRRLVDQAQNDRALGVRWAVYDNSNVPSVIIDTMKRAGFVSARRRRELLVYGSPELSDSTKWNMNDFYVSFDY